MKHQPATAGGGINIFLQTSESNVLLFQLSHQMDHWNLFYGIAFWALYFVLCGAKLVLYWCINMFLKGQTMVRQSISVSEPNDEWLKAQVASAEYRSKSEAINDLIRQARRRQLEIEHIRSELIKAEQSGFIDEQPEDLLANFKEEARQDGLL